MQLGMIGLGRMGGNMAKRIMAAGHETVVHDLDESAVADLVREGATGAGSLQALVGGLAPPRCIWVMVPAAFVDGVIDELTPLLDAADLIVDGGNSHYHDDIRRAEALSREGLLYVDCGVSGGVWGAERGYCLMAGGEPAAIERLEPAFEALAPGVGAAGRTPGRDGPVAPEERGWLHCGPAGAGHLVKMVHNGIEYGMMAAYAEGLNLLRHANIGAQDRKKDAETTPLVHPEHFRFPVEVDRVAELWRRGSVIGSWLLDLTAQSLHQDPDLDTHDARVADSGEGRWTVETAIRAGVPLHVISASVFDRFSSRDEDEFAGKVLTAMRNAFGGH